MILHCDLVLLKSLLLGRVDLHLVLHEIMILHCDLVLLEPLLVARVRVPAKHKYIILY
jgi:hypothetical protein